MISIKKTMNICLLIVVMFLFLLPGCTLSRTQTLYDESKEKEYNCALKKIINDKNNGKDLNSESNIQLFERIIDNMFAAKEKCTTGSEWNIIQLLSSHYLEFYGKRDGIPSTLYSAIAFFHLRKYDKAGRILSEILEREPDNFIALTLVGCLSVTNEKNINFTPENWGKAYRKNYFLTLCYSQYFLRYIGIIQRKRTIRSERFYVYIFKVLASDRHSWKDNDLANSIIYSLSSSCFIRLSLYHNLFFDENLLSQGIPTNISIKIIKSDNVFKGIKALKVGFIVRFTYHKQSGTAICSGTRHLPKQKNILLIMTGVLNRDIKINLSHD